MKVLNSLRDTRCEVRGTRIAWLFLLVLLTACKKEIDFDYNEVAPIVVVEGRVTNEGTEVVVTKSRSVIDSVMGRCQTGAVVVVSHNGKSETIPYDGSSNSYRSSLKGKAGDTYRLTIDFEGHHYEGEATMPAAAPILSAEFIWFSMLDERMVVYEMWARDPAPDERNYYLYRINRITHHPHFMDKKSGNGGAGIIERGKAYMWSVFDDRGNPPGLLYRDIFCMSERAAKEDEEENWERILYEGDTITFKLMTIDRPTYDYFTSLRTGQNGGANPRSNLTGGCLGYFTAGSVTRADTLVFRYDAIKEEATFKIEN